MSRTLTQRGFSTTVSSSLSHASYSDKLRKTRGKQRSDTVGVIQGGHRGRVWLGFRGHPSPLSGLHSDPDRKQETGSRARRWRLDLRQAAVAINLSAAEGSLLSNALTSSCLSDVTDDEHLGGLAGPGRLLAGCPFIAPFVCPPFRLYESLCQLGLALARSG